MKISKQQVLQFIERRHGSERAAQAGQELPDEIDHEEHADTLSQLGVDPQELLDESGGSGGEAVSQAGGGPGGITGDLGSSNAAADELAGSAGQSGGTAASGQGGQVTGGS